MAGNLVARGERTLRVKTDQAVDKIGVADINFDEGLIPGSSAVAAGDGPGLYQSSADGGSPA